MLSQKKQDSMDIVDGLTLGIGGTILTILGFGIALFLGTYTKEKKEKQIEEDKDNPIVKFWNDFRSK
tara:strand:- start:5024 stop:5224 length:201 start_codon:yes stop_codon:yes gene_type:complete